MDNKEKILCILDAICEAHRDARMSEIVVDIPVVDDEGDGTYPRQYLVSLDVAALAEWLNTATVTP